MRRLDNKAVIRRLFDDVLNAGNLKLVDGLIATSYVEHNPAPGQTAGAAGVRLRVHFYGLENGQIGEHWHNIDELGLLRQLGVAL